MPQRHLQRPLHSQHRLSTDSTITTLGKRPRALPSEQATTHPTSTPKRLKLNPPKRREREQRPPSPLPLHHFLSRGIVPMLASSPEQRFEWRSSTNIRLTKRHSINPTFLAALNSLIKSGRRYRGKTPGITIKTPKERAIRYEYWPVFDEYVDEHEWKPTWPKTETPLGKELSEGLVRELSEYFYRPAGIPEMVDSR